MIPRALLWKFLVKCYQINLSFSAFIRIVDDPEIRYGSTPGTCYIVINIADCECFLEED
jgi:hypothetical protein